MLFNSIDFAIFLPIVFSLYWLTNKWGVRTQNLLLVIVSLFFYGWWDIRFLALLLFSTMVDFTVGVLLSKEANITRRKIMLGVSIFLNLGLLMFFKYFNFFITSFVDAFSFFGTKLELGTLNILLPVGISFYTFQTMSYAIDVYKKEIEPTKDLIAFGAYVAYFPQLVAGPIERAGNLLPQILAKRKFETEKALEGVRLMLWGFFKKIVIADAIAPSVNEIFQHYENYSSPILIMGAVFFAFQIYCDFSGYSDIARGVSKMLGIELMVNFNFPYFSRSISEFWRRWHISLSTWFRDYLYIPLGGSRVALVKGVRNVFLVFLISGFWHGANWTFLAWGAIHAALFIPSFVLKENRRHLGNIQPTKFYLPTFQDFIRICFTFVAVTIAWIFFRASDIQHALEYIHGIFSWKSQGSLFFNPYDNQPLFKEYLYLAGFILVEYLLVSNIINFYSKKMMKNLIIDAVLLTIIVINCSISSNLEFIYFQF